MLESSDKFGRCMSWVITCWKAPGGSRMVHRRGLGLALLAGKGLEGHQIAEHVEG